MESIWPILLTLGGALVAIWATVKYIIIAEVRIDANVFKTLYKVGKNDRMYVISEDFLMENKYPLDFIAFFYLRDCPWFTLSHSERLLTAGWQSKDYVSKIICLRWNQFEIKKYLVNQLENIQIEELGIPVELMMPHFTDKIGSLKMIPPQPLLDESVYKDFENEIESCLKGNINKTGALFYGPPGNGKTVMVKYLALKYKLPIKIFTLSPDFSNHDLMLLFSQITPRCIVLFEDFDNYFDGRDCVIGKGNNSGNTTIKFTFDVILNGLDGIYNTYKENVFIMTVNDICKVDRAIKNRPSRFKFLKRIDNPDLKIRQKLLPVDWAMETDGMNLDQIFMMKNFYDMNLPLESALCKVNEDRKSDCSFYNI